jgi:formylglycine-generating enzyme required for sulfatase activity
MDIPTRRIPFGLYQVYGNVFEWTKDCFNKRYNEDKPADGSPWLEGDCSKGMLRGGTWDWMANLVRAAIARTRRSARTTAFAWCGR